MFGCAVSARQCGRQWATCCSFLMQMQQCFIQPDVVAYNASIIACVKVLMEAWKRFTEMKKRSVPPNVFTYIFLIQSCTGCNAWEQIIGFLADAQENKINPICLCTV